MATSEVRPTAEGDDDVAPLADLTAFQQELLLAMAPPDAPRHGLGLKARVETVLGEEVNHGRLYPNLDELVDAGLVAKGEIDRRTNSYELTAAGERRLRADVERRQAVLGGDSAEARLDEAFVQAVYDIATTVRDFSPREPPLDPQADLENGSITTALDRVEPLLDGGDADGDE